MGRTYRIEKAYESQVRRAQAVGAAWNAADKLVTLTKFITSGAFQNRPEIIQHPDGTLTRYEYASTPTDSTVTTYHGAANVNGDGITDGTKTVTISNKAGQVLSRTVRDYVSNIITDQVTYGNFDEQERHRLVTYLDGTTESRTFDCCGLATTTDRDGVMTSYGYDALGRLETKSRLNIVLMNFYDTKGNLYMQKRQGTDASQITLWQRSYDGLHRPLNETNALNGVTTFSETIDGNGQIVHTTTHPDTGTRIETYFKDGQLAKVTGTAVNPVRYEYGVEQDGTVWRAYTKEIKLDANHADTSEWTKTYTDLVGRSYKTVFAGTGSPYQQSFFNSKGQLWKTRDPDDVRSLFQYNARGELDYTAVDLDRDDVIDFNGTDRITQTVSDVYYNGTTNVRRTRTYVHTTDNSTATLLLSTAETSTDGLRSWQTVYRDSPSTPVTSQTRTVYAGGGNRYLTNTAPDGSYAVSAYLNGRLTTVTRKTSSGTQLSQTTYGYDAHGRQSTVTDARNGTTTFTFNAADQVVTSTTPPPGTGQPAQVTHPDGTFVTNEFFLTGLPKKTSGSRTYPVEYTYDPQGRMKTMKTWQNFARGTGTAITTWNYDAYRGWLNSKDYADPTTGAAGTVGPDYTYTAAGRMATRLWARGSPRVTTTYAYNNAGDLYTVTYNDGTTPGVTYTYDQRGRHKTIVCNGITTTLAFNDANQPLTESYAGGTLGGLTVTSGYDTLLRRTTLSVNTSPSALSYAYAYDTASRLTNVTEGTYGAGYAYLANSLLVSQITFKQGSTVRLTTSKDYDRLNRLQAIASQPSGSGQLPLAYSYQYNDANQRTRLTLTDGSFWIYSYDSLGQVVSGKRYWPDGTPVPGQQKEYAFDDIGNRASTKSGGDANGANLRSASYTANRLNQYSNRTVPGGFDVVGIAPASTSVTVNSSAADYRRSEYFQEQIAVVNTSVPVWQNVSVTTGGGGSASGNVWTPKTPENYGYDLDGNTTSDGRWTYSWDAENRLTRLVANTTVGPQQRIDFEYDWRGRRIRKKVWNNTGGTGTPAVDLKFLYDGWNLTAELDANAGSNLKRSYVWGLDLSGSEQGAGGVGGLLLVKPASGNPLFVAYDGNGNVTGLIDATTGTISAQYEYGPFGETIRMSGTGTVAKDNPLRFSTKYQDDESDLLYYGHRYYDPATGRWLSRDALDEEDTFNLYAFVLNSPISYHDHLGQWTSGKFGYPDIHGRAVDQALPNLSAADRSMLKKGVVEADAKEYQTTDASYRHAMNAATETVAVSKHRANCFVRTQIRKAQLLEKDGRHKEAMRQLAFAMHCLQDNTSPMHNYFQTWDANYPLKKIKAHADGESTLPAAGHALFTATRDAWDFFKGTKEMPSNFFP